MFDSRLRALCGLATALVLAACGTPTSYSSQTALNDGGNDDGAMDNMRGVPKHDARPSRDAHPAQDAPVHGSDASTADARPIDASPADAGSSGGGGPPPSAIVSCYSDGFPNTTCALPTHCCFSNYSAQHNGECTSSSCTWGTIECDGPEDCASGQHCCAHVLSDPVEGLIGYRLACQRAACGAAPANQELCHTTASLVGTCSTGTRCVTAAGNNADLPGTLHICK